MIIEEVLFKNANVLIQNAKSLPSELNQVVDMIVEEAKINRHICFMGVGKSHTISIKAMETACSLGIPSISLCGFSSLHGDLGCIVPNQLVISFSKSGETTEILQCLQGCGKRGAKIVSITCNTNSSADRITKEYNGICINLICNEEADSLKYAPTNSTILFASISDALLIIAAEKMKITKELFLENHSAGSLAEKIKKELSEEQK